MPLLSLSTDALHNYRRSEYRFAATSNGQTGHYSPNVHPPIGPAF